MSGPTLREMEWPDIPELARWDRELFGSDAWPEATWWAELAQRPRREYVVVAGDSGILGYAGLDVSGDSADVMTIAVVPDAQGRGIGRLLLDELIARAARRGASALLLEVRADNSAALSLYEATGFARLAVRPRYYQPDDVDAVVMRRLIEQEARHVGQ